MLAALLLAAGAAAEEINPPDISLDTLPVVYYGANWNRTQQNIDVLARFQMVILMQVLCFPRWSPSASELRVTRCSGSDRARLCAGGRPLLGDVLPRPLRGRAAMRRAAQRDGHPGLRLQL